MNAPQGLILLAHGARNPVWSKPFEDLAQGLREARPGLPVALAFLELMSPDLPSAIDQLVAQGCHHVQVLPCFLGQGGHVARDVPPLLEAARARHPDTRLSLWPALGEQPAMLRALQQVCLSLLDESAA